MRLRAIAVIGTVVGLLLAQGAGAEQSYTDPAGDAGAGTDITGISVRNDAAGRITFAVTTAAPVPPDHALLVVLDTDKNPATGDVGSDFLAITFPRAAFVFLSRATPTGFEPVDGANTTFSISGNVIEMGLMRSDLGNTVGFEFVFGSGDIVSGTLFDFAPAVGAFTYDLPACSNGVDDDRDGAVDHPADRGCTAADDTDETNPAAPLRLTAGKPQGSGQPVAGRSFTVVMTVTRSDGKPMTSGAVTCRVAVGGAAIPARGSRAGNRARCTMRPPKGSKGKPLRGTIGVQVGRAKVTRSFGFRVR